MAIKAAELKAALKTATGVDFCRNHSALWIRADQKGGKCTQFAINYAQDNGQRFYWGLDSMAKLGGLILVPSGAFIDFKIVSNNHYGAGVKVAELWAIVNTPRAHSMMIDYQIMGPENSGYVF